LTANTTPRLGLMSPTNADPFTPDDFAATFGILDAKPGITPVANYASLPANLTTNQHMSMYVQVDNGAMWYWYQPSSGSPGSWKRANSIGLLGSTSQNSNISTTTTNPSAGPTLMSLTVTAPGGRPIRISVDCRSLQNNSSACCAVTSLWLGSGIVVEHGSGAKASTVGVQQFYDFIYTPTPGQVMTWKVTLRGAAVPGGGGTTTANAISRMWITEV
jgi:hypothetical protein